MSGALALAYVPPTPPTRTSAVLRVVNAELKRVQDEWAAELRELLGGRAAQVRRADSGTSVCRLSRAPVHALTIARRSLTGQRWRCSRRSSRRSAYTDVLAQLYA
jgi:hypothetical protein